MSSIEQPVEIDGDKLQQFVFRAVDEVRRRPPLNARLVMMGDKLDLYPNSTCVGSDYHHGSIETARRRAKEAGVADRVRFQIEPAAAYSGSGYDLVTMFDCLCDMGDPVGAARDQESTPDSAAPWKACVSPAFLVVTDYGSTDHNHGGGPQ